MYVSIVLQYYEEEGGLDLFRPHFSSHRRSKKSNLYFSVNPVMAPGIWDGPWTPDFSTASLAEGLVAEFIPCLQFLLLLVLALLARNC